MYLCGSLLWKGPLLICESFSRAPCLPVILLSWLGVKKGLIFSTLLFQYQVSGMLRHSTATVAAAYVCVLIWYTLHVYVCKYMHVSSLYCHFFFFFFFFFLKIFKFLPSWAIHSWSLSLKFYSGHLFITSGIAAISKQIKSFSLSFVCSLFKDLNLQVSSEK